MNTALRFRLTFNNELEFINNTLSLVQCRIAAGIAVKWSGFRMHKSLIICVAIYWCRMCEPVCVDWLEHEWVLPIRSLYERWRAGLGGLTAVQRKNIAELMQMRAKSSQFTVRWRQGQVSEVCHEHFKIWCWSSGDGIWIRSNHNLNLKR